MVIIVSFAAIFSPLSSNIYFPALSEISKVSPHPSNFHIIILTVA
jgi:hypothetical protein